MIAQELRAQHYFSVESSSPLAFDGHIIGGQVVFRNPNPADGIGPTHEPKSNVPYRGITGLRQFTPIDESEFKKSTTMNGNLYRNMLELDDIDNWLGQRAYPIYSCSLVSP